MPTPFIMPKFDMDQQNATIVEWLKQEGDQVNIDEPVLTVETDKVAMDVPSPASGKLARISYQPGEVVAVTTVIAYVLGEGETEDDLPEEAHVQENHAGKSAGGFRGPRLTTAGQISEPEDGGTLEATPLATRMAQSLGIDLKDVQAAGGKVRKEDIESFILGKQSTDGRLKTPATPAARRLAREMGIEIAGVTGSGPGGRVHAQDVKAYQKEVEIPTAVVPDEPAVIPLAGIRKTIADRMQSSFQEAPHIALTVEVNVHQLQAIRERMNVVADRQGDQSLSLTALLVYIVAWGLGRNPMINSTLDGDEIKLLPEINIGVATALENGLIVPVIRNANRKSVKQLNTELQDLTRRARQGKLILAEVKGGTFTISNLGMYGIDQFRAIINPPESAILAVGTVVRKPIVINDRDEIAVRPMMRMTLSADHRVIDGVTAAKFLADLVQAVETADIFSNSQPHE